ncbi:alpha/beta hydrolase [Fortiea sp. LEGE XX443]|uniref:alpha/beta hydrolase n=1 Tax=Fortiea sp. LEGE XX443 TaxID=1828611 RepID=UPI00187E8F8B|nr:alpha/beta hydrolase [Fortiea sp. LEGE XX443]MBE9004189.1 alpha/beta hydrolase [Fortiea sp. LEGE XX443]
MQLFQRLNQLTRWKFTKLLNQTVALGVSASVLLFNASANAAEQVILKYGSFQGPVSVAELNEFVKTGKTTPTLEAYLQESKQDPDVARKALIAGIKAEPAYLDRLLSGWTGPIIISQVGEVVYPPTGRLDARALRTAVNKSIQEDGEITLLGAIRHYPEDTVALEGDRLISVYERLSSLANIL